MVILGLIALIAFLLTDHTVSGNLSIVSHIRLSKLKLLNRKRAMMETFEGVEALIFDVFGTVGERRRLPYYRDCSGLAWVGC